MKITITYENSNDSKSPCYAVTKFNGNYLGAIGRTWTESRDRLLDKIRSADEVGTPPPPEEIELP